MNFADAVLHACQRQSEENLRFPAFVALLWRAGVGSYTVQVDTLATRYSGRKGESHFDAGGPVRAVASAYDGGALESAVRASQRGELERAVFMDRLAAAGIASFEARLDDRTVVYAGHGRTYAEAIPH